jgi:hypothetical protein
VKRSVCLFARLQNYSIYTSCTDPVLACCPTDSGIGARATQEQEISSLIWPLYEDDEEGFGVFSRGAASP